MPDTFPAPSLSIGRRDIVDVNNDIKAQIAPPDRFTDAMESGGIGDDTDAWWS